MPARPPLRVCADCGRKVRYTWTEVVRCPQGKGCKAAPAVEAKPSSQGTEIPF